MTDSQPSSSSRKPLRIVVLISGGGSTLANLIAHIGSGPLTGIEIAGVVSSRADVRGVEIARDASLECRIVPSREYSDDESYSVELTNVIDAFAPDLVVMGGFLRKWLFPVHRYENRVLNIHPSLLPNFGGAGMYGRRVHEAVLASGATESGCTVHLVDHEYDHGPILAQRKLKIAANETPATLAARVGELERALYPAVLQQIADRGIDGLSQIHAD